MARILHIENYPDYARTIADAFSTKHEVTTAASIAEAREMLDHDTFDLIISDVELGKGITGAEFASELRKAGSTTPFIMHTNVDWDTLVSTRKIEQKISDAGQDAPISGYVQKGSNALSSLRTMIAKYTSNVKSTSQSLTL